MINYMMPGLYTHKDVNFTVLQYMKDNPEQFIDNMKIYCVYGSFPHNIWDGGRIQENVIQISIDEVREILDIYHSLGVRCRLVCTNAYLEEKHLSNRWMNLVLQQLDERDEIVLSSPLLEDYLKKNYPKIGLISSTTKRLDTFELLNKELEKSLYRMVCLDYDLNSYIDELKTITNKDKCEFLVNAICGPKCPIRKEHYRLNAIFNLNYGKKFTLPDDCRIQWATYHPTVKKYKNTITKEDIINKYYPLGFSNFKLEGRTWGNIEAILSYAQYMTKDEYTLYFIHSIMMDVKNAGVLEV